MKLAPIVLFVYNRPHHTKQTIDALLKNSLASQSEIFIYSDAAKNQESVKQVQEVRSYIHSIRGFTNITIIEREKNFGLADSIIDGVTKIVNQYGKIIVLEDDIVVSPVFLEYMNNALQRYQKEEKVWCIAGWNYPINFDAIEEDTFFGRIPHCWGWATWANRWKFFKRDMNWVEKNFNSTDIKNISLEHTADFWKHYVANKRNKIKTWAIFWYLAAYKQNALTLVPKHSLITQIGFDSSATHCKKDHLFANQMFATKTPKEYPKEIEENKKALLLIQNFHRNEKRIIKRIFRKLKMLCQIIGR